MQAAKEQPCEGIEWQRGKVQECGIDAVRVVAFAYDTYTNPSKNNGVLRATLTNGLDRINEIQRILN